MEYGYKINGNKPVGGLSWEYEKSEEKSVPLPISPGQKIKVFISSICSVDKYEKVRAGTKKGYRRHTIS